MIVSMKTVLDIADAENMAIGAFNVTELEGIQAVLGAAEELGQPVILQFAPVHEEYISLKTLGPIMVLMADKAKVPVCVHLDHCDNFDMIREALSCMTDPCCRMRKTVHIRKLQWKSPKCTVRLWRLKSAQ